MLERPLVSGVDEVGSNGIELVANLPTKIAGYGLATVPEKSSVESLQLVRGKEVMK